jgi:hypothetical protein
MTFRICRAIGLAGVPVGVVLIVVALMHAPADTVIGGVHIQHSVEGVWAALAYLGAASIAAAVVGLIVCWRIMRAD